MPELQRRRSRFRKMLLAVTSVIAVCGVAAFACFFVLRSQFENARERSRRDIAARQTQILADFELLKSKPVFAKTTRERNAERFLSGFIEWSGPGAKALRTAEAEMLRALRTSFASPLSTANTWAHFTANPNLYEVDLTWIDQLAAYDHFDLDSNPDLDWKLKQAESLGVRERSNLSLNLPTPDCEGLRFAAVARAAQLKKRGQAIDVLPLYRHVARLLWSSDTTIGAATAVQMLEDEKRLADLLNLNERSGDLTFVEVDQLLAMKRALGAWVSMQASIATDGLGAFEPYLKRESGACVLTRPSQSLVTDLRNLFEPESFAEPSFAQEIKTTKAFRLRLLDVCDHPAYQVFVRPAPESAEPLIIARHQLNPVHVPFVRRAYGFKLLKEAGSDSFKFYETRTPRVSLSRSPSLRY